MEGRTCVQVATDRAKARGRTIRLAHPGRAGDGAGGVWEYWIIDPPERAATFLVREGDHFVERSPRDHVYPSRVLEGFDLDVRWLWPRPLPPTMPTVQRLLQQV